MGKLKNAVEAQEEIKVTIRSACRYSFHLLKLEALFVVSDSFSKALNRLLPKDVPKPQGTDNLRL